MKKILFLLLIVCNVQSYSQTYPVGLNIKDNAPDFSATDQTGKRINLKKQLKKGNVVLIFYRGQWCPYCNKQLKQLEDSITLIKAKGATVLAITPELPENISKTIEKTKASYPVLYDEGLKIMNAYKVAFRVDDKTVEKYKGYGIDFLKANGNNGANLPVPAVYIINKKGKITYRFFDVNYTKRSSIKDILDHL
ncbi:MAG TPA: peroxiredoxin-like family protein [Chitinophagaceae bacterium]|nr:peroxiredoxin-like family protein [Chitinophagaceae bacterium]